MYQTHIARERHEDRNKMSGQRRKPPATNTADINPGTEDSDAILVVEDSAAAFASLVHPFMASMTAAIATDITNASINAVNIAAAAAKAVRTIPKAVASISSWIDPFDNLSTDMNTREGKAL